MDKTILLDFRLRVFCIKPAIFILIFLLAFFYPFFESHGIAIHDDTFKRLDRIREYKKKQLIDYMERLRRNAGAVKNDKIMLDFFCLKNKYYQLQKKGPPPEDLAGVFKEYKNKIKNHYLRYYLSFYDILFINQDGDIFYTIRKQADYHKNIFKGNLSKTVLARHLKSHPDETFVDYHHYIISDEPSAFIVEPVLKDDRFTGWIVFQCAISKINNMFTHEKGLGVTGEVFLVNKQNYMLTDSRFFGESSILKRHLSKENIESKFREGAGHKIVIDYRGFKALTSFEVCRIGDSEWLLITKIDENEIVTEQYEKNRDRLAHRIVDGIVAEKTIDCEAISPGVKPVVADMDEFRKASGGKWVCTYGVSTCTAVIVSYPSKFTYLSHISNLDRIYGGGTTDLIGRIFRQIKTFDIYRYELRALEATIIANQKETVIPAIDRLLDEGLFLSQIKFMYNPNAHYANVLHDNNTDRTTVEWVMNRDTGEKKYQCSQGVKTIGDLFKPIIDCQ